MDEQQGPGRPRHTDTPQTVTFRVPASLVQQLDQWAAARGMSRNQAGGELLRLAMAPPTGGYNPKIGRFE